METRDLLFGDLPLDGWPSSAAADVGDAEPWRSFIAARKAMAEGRVAEAVEGWLRVIDMPGLESRHYLQAWTFLRQRGVQPPAEQAGQILGVVLEVPVGGGLDLLAAYRDRTARYFNYSGRAAIWEHPNNALDSEIDVLLAAGEKIVRAIGAGGKPRPPAPPADQARLNFMTPAGLAFGQAPMSVLMNDPAAKAVVIAGTGLMQKLVASGGGAG
jgi:hypothetical protein